MSERAAPEKRNTITAGPGGTESASAASASPKKRKSHTTPLESQSRAFKGGRTKRRTDGIDGWMEYKVQEVSLLKQRTAAMEGGGCDDVRFHFPFHPSTTEILSLSLYRFSAKSGRSKEKHLLSIVCCILVPECCLLPVSFLVLQMQNKGNPKTRSAVAAEKGGKE